MFDLIIKKGMAVLPDAVEVVDIAVKNGVIAAIAPTIDERAVREINALGQYVLQVVKRSLKAQKRSRHFS